MGLFDVIAFLRAWAGVAAGAALIYWVTQAVYLLYFHPAAKFRGPKFAAVSYTTYCYHWLVLTQISF